MTLSLPKFLWKCLLRDYLIQKGAILYIACGQQQIQKLGQDWNMPSQWRNQLGKGPKGFCCFRNSVPANILACLIEIYLFCTVAVCLKLFHFSLSPYLFFFHNICFFLAFSQLFRANLYNIHNAVKNFYLRGEIVFPPYTNLIFGETNIFLVPRLCTSSCWRISLLACPSPSFFFCFWPKPKYNIAPF